MAFDKHLIAPLKNGLELNMPPWLIPDDAFEELNNAWVFRGTLRKRFGSSLTGVTAATPDLQQLNSRLRIPLQNASGTTDGAGAAAGNVALNGGGVVYRYGQAFSIGDEIYYVPADGVPVVLLTTGVGTGTFNTTTGDYTFAGAPALTQIIFYSALSVQGINQIENRRTSASTVNIRPSIAFDWQFAYLYTTEWNKFGPATGDIWHGTDDDFFWAWNWLSDPGDNLLFVSNFFVGFYNGPGNPAVDDTIRIYDTVAGTWRDTAPTTALANGIYFLPNPTGVAPQVRYTGPYVKTARVIVDMEYRLLLLNTVENDNPNGDGTLGTNTNYPNRLRFSAKGNPLAQNAWYENQQNDSSATPGGLSLFAGGGVVDAPTVEEIISAQFIKNRLIVYFERSTYEIVYTASNSAPFRWQLLNDELGAESTFSVVPFDKAVIGIGNVGVHACNGSNVERIDSKIPDYVWTVVDANSGRERVVGIRDYFAETVYWALRTGGTAPRGPFPDKILVYNYNNNTWALFDDCITFFGYHEELRGAADVAQSKEVLIGNQEGFIVFLERDTPLNAGNMQISAFNTGTNTLTIRDHTLKVGDYIQLLHINGVSIDTGTNIVRVETVPSNNTLTVSGSTFSGVYLGGGIAARVSQFDVLTKQFTPYVADDTGVYLGKIKAAIQRTTDGEISVDYFPDSTTISLITAGQATGANIGTNVLESRPFNVVEQSAVRVWHEVFFNSRGSHIQLRFFWDDTQMKTAAYSQVSVVIEAIILFTQPTGEM